MPVRGPWIKDFLDEAEIFPYGAHDDQVDAASLALAKLAHGCWGPTHAAWPGMHARGAACGTNS
jgi:hypothetical protein